MNLRVENVAKYLAFGLEVPGTILGGVVLGYLADAKFGTGPWLTILGSVLGFVGAVFRLIKYLKFFRRGKSKFSRRVPAANMPIYD